MACQLLFYLTLYFLDQRLFPAASRNMPLTQSCAGLKGVVYGRVGGSTRGQEVALCPAVLGG